MMIGRILCGVAAAGFATVALSAVAAAQYLRGLPQAQAFIARHPGTGASAYLATDMPAWLRVQHFLNLFFLVFIIRAGLQILADHPRLPALGPVERRSDMPAMSNDASRRRQCRTTLRAVGAVERGSAMSAV